MKLETHFYVKSFVSEINDLTSRQGSKLQEQKNEIWILRIKRPACEWNCKHNRDSGSGWFLSSLWLLIFMILIQELIPTRKYIHYEGDWFFVLMPCSTLHFHPLSVTLIRLKKDSVYKYDVNISLFRKLCIGYWIESFYRSNCL